MTNFNTLLFFFFFKRGKNYFGRSALLWKQKELLMLRLNMKVMIKPI